MLAFNFVFIVAQETINYFAKTVGLSALLNKYGAVFLLAHQICIFNLINNCIN